MKAQKIFLIVLSTSLLLSACSGNDKWNKDISSMPKEWIQKQQDGLNKNLDLLKKNPEDLEAQGMAGFYYYELGALRQAEVAYKKSLELDHNDFRSLNNLAKLYEEVGEYDKAAIYVKRLYDLNRDNASVTQDAVKILLEANDPEAAQQALDSFADLKQKDEGGVINQLYTDILNYRTKHQKKLSS